jgi:lysophospholipid acyltransferase (LPLAT)-like uncharacterized protein
MAKLVFVLERLLIASLRYEWNRGAEIFDAAQMQPVIYCLWHNRLALSMLIYRRITSRRRPGRPLAALVSASKDGALLSAVLQEFGVQPVRGSTSRRGHQALLELTTWAERNYDLAITPDGPRGPRYVVQEGTVALAQLTGLPIVPVSYHATPKFSLRSWDKFQIPLPFAKCRIVFGKPVSVPREASDGEREALRAELERWLRENSVD